MDFSRNLDKIKILCGEESRIIDLLQVANKTKVNMLEWPFYIT